MIALSTDNNLLEKVDTCSLIIDEKEEPRAVKESSNTIHGYSPEEEWTDVGTRKVLKVPNNTGSVSENETRHSGRREECKFPAKSVGQTIVATILER